MNLTPKKMNEDKILNGLRNGENIIFSAWVYRSLNISSYADTR